VNLDHRIRSIVSRSLPLGSTATLAAVPAMSLIPFAPLKLAPSLAILPSMSLFPKAPFDLSLFPSMSRDARRLHSLIASLATLP